jgi:hypothetical protein
MFWVFFSISGLILAAAGSAPPGPHPLVAHVTPRATPMATTLHPINPTIRMIQQLPAVRTNSVQSRRFRPPCEEEC